MYISFDFDISLPVGDCVAPSRIGIRSGPLCIPASTISASCCTGRAPTSGNTSAASALALARPRRCRRRPEGCRSYSLTWPRTASTSATSAATIRRLLRRCGRSSRRTFLAEAKTRSHTFSISNSKPKHLRLINAQALSNERPLERDSTALPRPQPSAFSSFFQTFLQPF